MIDQRTGLRPRPTRRLSWVGLGLLSSCLGLLGGLPASLAWSAEDTGAASPWQISADKISRFVNPPSVIAEGNVSIVRQGVRSVGQLGKVEDGVPPAGGGKPLTISGDWIRLDPTTNLIKVRGHAVLDSLDEHITADLADLDMDKQTGHLQHATLYFPQSSLYLAGEEVEKTGDLSYHLENGWVTKCAPANGQAPPWSFGWRRADITQGGFAHFTNATFRVRDLSVLYSPYVAFPTNTKRKTGALFPEVSSSRRDGLGVLAPLFVNISPSQDLTLYAGGLAERGPLAAAEFRYVQDIGSKGIVELNLLDDRQEDTAGDDFKSDGALRTTTERYWLRGKADHDFGNHLNGKLDFDLVSDQDYLEEYSSGLIGYSESARMFTNEFGRGFEAKTTSARANTAQLAKLWPTMTLAGEVRGVSDPSGVPSSNYPWSLPSLTFAGSRPLARPSSAASGLSSLAAVTDLTWDSGYAYYLRKEGPGGQRLDLHPVLKAPLRLSPYLETIGALGLRQTMVQAEDNGTMGGGIYDDVVRQRTITDTTLATSTILMRDFELKGSRLQRLTHMIRPGLAYTYVPAVSQEEMPFVDPLDLIRPENLLTYGISNDFEVVGTSGKAWKMGYARLSQAYDIHAARRDPVANDRQRVWTAVDLESWLQPIPDLKLLYETKVDIYGAEGDNYRVGASYLTPQGNGLAAEHRYDPVQAINQLNLDLSLRLTRTLQAQALINHSLDTDETSDTSLRLLYTPSCWGLALQATTTPDDAYRVTLLFSLDGVGNILGLSQNISSGGGVGGGP